MAKDTQNTRKLSPIVGPRRARRYDARPIPRTALVWTSVCAGLVVLAIALLGGVDGILAPYGMRYQEIFLHHLFPFFLASPQVVLKMVASALALGAALHLLRPRVDGWWAAAYFLLAVGGAGIMTRHAAHITPPYNQSNLLAFYDLGATWDVTPLDQLIMQAASVLIVCGTLYPPLLLMGLWCHRGFQGLRNLISARQVSARLNTWVLPHPTGQRTQIQQGQYRLPPLALVTIAIAPVWLLELAQWMPAIIGSRTWLSMRWVGFAGASLIVLIILVGVVGLVVRFALGSGIYWPQPPAASARDRAVGWSDGPLAGQQCPWPKPSHAPVIRRWPWALAFAVLVIPGIILIRQNPKFWFSNRGFDPAVALTLRGLITDHPGLPPVFSLLPSTVASSSLVSGYPVLIGPLVLGLSVIAFAGRVDQHLAVTMSTVGMLGTAVALLVPFAPQYPWGAEQSLEEITIFYQAWCLALLVWPTLLSLAVRALHSGGGTDYDYLSSTHARVWVVAVIWVPVASMLDTLHAHGADMVLALHLLGGGVVLTVLALGVVFLADRASTAAPAEA